MAADLQATMVVRIPDAVSALAEALPDGVIQAALQTIKKEPIRRRALPPEVVIWLVIGMALLRERCISAVVSHLRLAAVGPRTVSGSAIVKARYRLGEQPMAALFAYTADAWALPSAAAAPWRGLALFGVDGTTLRIADTAENEVAFGRPGSAPGRGKSGYPQVRLVGLSALRSHLLYAAALGPYGCGECTLAKKLWYLLPDRSLTLVDRGFIDYALFHDIMASGQERHFLTRSKKNLRWEVLSELGPGDRLVRLTLSAAVRRKRPELPESLIVRAIDYQRKGFRLETLLTSLIDAQLYPADEVRVLYHERWEIELTYGEVKTHTLEREESIRSKSPERVRQEIWGLLIAYNLVRRHIERFADHRRLDPLRISFRGALLLVRNTCICAAYGVGSTRKLLDAMDEEMNLLILPPRRPRRYARAVKIKMSNYSRNSARGGTRLA
ncbi:MAG: IS4 family transposase [Deltaproteobacteria bacterium]